MTSETHDEQSVLSRWLQATNAESTNPSERRKRARVAVRWPVSMCGTTSDLSVETTTENLSSVGFYCLSPVALEPGVGMTCILKIPAHHPASPGRSAALQCSARVVRVEPPNQDDQYGVGCEISDYRLVDTPEAGS